MENRIKAYRNLAISAALSILICSVLFWLSPRPNRYPNGFKRSPWISQLSHQFTYEHTHDRLALVGVSANNLIFIDFRKNSLNIVDIDKPGLNSESTNLPIHTAPSSHTFRLSGDGILIYDYRSAKITELSPRYTFVKSTVAPRHFQRIERLPNGYLLKVADPAGGQVKLTSLSDSGTLSVPEVPLDETQDGGITTDGYLLYDDSTETIVHTHFYRNGFEKFDLDLTHLGTVATIDTVKQGNVEVSSLGDGKKRVYSIKNVPAYVHGYAAVAGGKLYIKSYLKADNETLLDFNNHDVIDVYDIALGKHLHTIGIPFLRGSGCSGFKVAGKRIALQYGNALLIYSI